MNFNYDIIVVGGGHAGCEAAMSASRMGSRVLLITMDINSLAKMSCNPAVGGIAKGQIVREIDALGGYTGIVTDASTLQFRMLNKSKGPAMWSPRAQCDKNRFSENWRKILVSNCNINIYIDSVIKFVFENEKITGVCTLTGAKFYSRAVILTAGTFLSGKLFIGLNSFEGGRIGEKSSYGLTEQLSEKGIKSDRMKTGTPPRINIRSVDLTKGQRQDGDVVPEKFSYLPFLSSAQSSAGQIPCYIFHTNERVHEILRSGFEDSPLFSGMIHGKGPRYCPSIEDKLRTFADKDSHPLYLEPEGLNNNEYYLQGFSSSLPLDIQISALQFVEGFENVEIFKPAYAVEYDYFDPSQLHHSLRSKVISNLFLAGQVNGTTGYEEAAAQGLMAGINAHQYISDKEEFILGRDEAYIGVLIDDLITKGVNEPYRMFTSRAEYRILLRQDNADLRLTEKSYKIGLADESRYRLTSEKYDLVSSLSDYTSSHKYNISVINTYLEKAGSTPLSDNKSIHELITRPELTLYDLVFDVPCGTNESIKENIDRSPAIEYMDSLISLNLPKCAEYSFGYDRDYSALEYGLCLSESSVISKNDQFACRYLDVLKSNFQREVLSDVEIGIKYKGYIDRERQMADKIQRLEYIKIPDNFNFDSISGLTIECRQKLSAIRPSTIGQASRISGVSPADISVLLVYFGR